MRVLDAAIKHFADNETKSALVPEWKGADGQPVRLYWKLMCPAERDALFANGAPKDIEIVIAKALDAEGKKVFEPADQLKMERAVSSIILTRLASLMLGTDAITQKAVAEAEKN